MTGMRWIGVVIVTGAILACPDTGAAQVYRWVDAKGTVHFTDQLSEVPPGVAVQVRDLPGGPILRGIPPAEAPTPPAPPSAPPLPPVRLIRAGEPPARVPEEIRARLAAELGVEPEEIVSVSPGLGRVELSGGRSRLLPSILDERPFLKEELEHPFLFGLTARRFFYPGPFGVLTYPGFYFGPSGFLPQGVQARPRPSAASRPMVPAPARSSAGSSPSATPAPGLAVRQR